MTASETVGLRANLSFPSRLKAAAPERNLCGESTTGRLILRAMAPTKGYISVFHEPLHPYTQALLSAIPTIGNGTSSMFDNPAVLLEGELPNPINLPPGCCFYNRCSARMDVCREIDPLLQNIDTEHAVACHLYGEPG